MNGGSTEGGLSRSQVAAVALSNGFEFYDFTAYAFFAAQIGRTFFPVASPWTSLTLSVATFGVGFVARPAGALFFGVYADRRGRRPAMLLALLMMALGTIGLAAAPGHALLGWGAAAFAVAARLVQGFALGGEIGPSSAYLVETAAPGHRARVLSWPIAMHGAAVLAAGLIGLAAASALPRDAFEDWGWRIPLLMGLGVVPAALVLRARLPEAPPGAPRPVLRPVFARPSLIAAAALVVASGAIAFYVAAYLTSYAAAVLKLPTSTALLAAVASGTAMLGLTPWAGRWADRFGRRRLFLVSRLGFAIMAVPGFTWLAAGGSTPSLIVVSAVLAALNTLGAPAGLCLVLEAMPKEARATGLAIAYTLGSSLFGGLAQPAATALIGWTGDPLSPAYLLVAAGLAGAGACLAIPEAGRNPVSPPA